MTYVTAIACGILTIFILILIGEYVKRFHIDLYHALRYYIAVPKPPRKFSEYRSVQWTVEFVKKLASLIPQLQFLRDLDRKMRQAGLPILGAEAIIITILLSILVGLIFLALTLDPVTAIVAGFITAAIICFMILRMILGRRQRFVNQMGDCLTTVSNALRAGFSFVQAMDLVSKEMEPPISEEFAHVMRDISYGMPMEQALQDMDNRVESPDFSLVVTAVLIQREIGGNLAQVLDTISDTINARIRMRREILALTAQGRMSAWILALLPVGIAALALMMNPHHFDEMLAHPLGYPVLIGALISEIIGFLVIQKIVNVKIE